MYESPTASLLTSEETTSGIIYVAWVVAIVIQK